MKKRLYLALLVILTMVFVWSGCNADSVEETSENITSEETDYSNTEESGKEAEESLEEQNAETSEVEETTEDMAEPTTEETTETDTSEEVAETPAYTVTDMEKTMYAQRSVNVRTGPTTDYEKLGALNTNDEVKVTGQADNGWYRIEYNGNTGFVSNNYLGEAKVAVNNTPATPNNNGTTTPATPTAPTTPSVDTTNAATRTVNGDTRYAFRTTANGTPIYDGIDWQWPQYIVDVINSCCTPGMSDMEKATALYNWMRANVTYKYSYEGGSTTTVATLSNRNANCNGYANAYQSLCCAVGITGSVIDGAQGPAQAGHAWNFIYIDGTRYFVDATQGWAPTTQIDMSTTNEYGQTVIRFLDENGNLRDGFRTIYYECWDGLFDKL